MRNPYSQQKNWGAAPSEDLLGPGRNCTGGRAAGWRYFTLPKGAHQDDHSLFGNPGPSHLLGEFPIIVGS